MPVKSSVRAIAAFAAMTFAVTLSGCGTTPGDRGVSGALLGAGAGAVIGSLSGDAGTGA